MQKCAFYLVRYVPDIVRGEFVNIGVILRVMSPDDHPLSIRFTRNWSRVLCLNPHADIEMFEALEEDLSRFLVTKGLSLDEALERLENQLSNNLQLEKGLGVTSVKGLLAKDTEREMDRLMAMYVEARKEPDVESTEEL